MDAQLKRGMLEACVLAALVKGESYGYKIIKDLPDSLGVYESTLYPILKRLEAGGSVTVRSAEHNGRLRKYYRITPQGVSRIQRFLEEWQTVMAIYDYIKGELYD